MLKKVSVATGLLFVLAVFCLFQVLTEGLGFWSLTSTHDDVSNLSNIALRQVNSVNETTQRLMDARINLSRAGTRMVRGGTEPVEIVQHAREQLALADKSFSAFLSAPKTGDENQAHAAALQEKFKAYHGALTELAQFLDSNNIQAFLDQPTQGFQDRYLGEQRIFANFSDAASQSYLDSIDARLNLFRGVGLAIFVALVIGVVLVHIGLRRGVIAPLEEAGRHFERIAEGKLDEVITRRTERLRGDYDKQLAAEKARADNAEAFAARYSEKVLADSIRAAAIKAGADDRSGGGPHEADEPDLSLQPGIGKRQLG